MAGKALNQNSQEVLDVPYEETFLRFLASLPEKKTTLRFFDRTEYFTVHGDDAIFVAKEIFKSMNIVRYIGSGEKEVPSVALGKAKFESTMRSLLLVYQYRVELYKNKGGKGARQMWYLSGKASPGNLQQFEDILFGNNEMSASAAVMAFKTATNSNQKIVGAAYVDVSERKIAVCEIADDDHFSNVEALLVQLAPKECIIQANDQSADAVKLKEIIQRSGVLVTEKKKSEFSKVDIVQDLNRLLKSNSGNSSTLPEVDFTIAMGCLAVIIKYLEILSDDSNFGRFNISTIDLSQYMKLDVSAVQALNLVPSPTDGSNRSVSLLGLLNKCQTAQGKRLLAQWIKQPLLDEKKIDERLNVVEVFFNNAVLRQTVQEQLKKFPDFSRIAKKFQKNKATLQDKAPTHEQVFLDKLLDEFTHVSDCVRVYHAVGRIQELVNSLDIYQDVHRALIDELFIASLQELAEHFSKYIELIETTIDLDQIEHHEYLIRPSFVEGLKECRENMDECEQRMDQELTKAAAELGLDASKTIKLERSNQFGYCFRVTRKEEKKLRGRERYTTLDTKKDGVRFTSVELKELNDQFQALKQSHDNVQSELAVEVIKVASGYAEPMQLLSDTIAKLDVLVSFSHVSACAPIPYSRPKILPKEQGSIVLQDVRHPCLEVQNEITFIPNDVALNRDEQSFLIITGPNMGGKSTYIRSIGVAVLMAQIGCFVPVEDAKISIKDAIMTRVGSSDSQLKGVSTFMAEMLETASILRNATENSLIIIDELGRGTSTYEGFGLAWAISQYISTRIKALGLFTTHLHELTALADEVKTVRNYHVTAMTTEDNVTLLYKIKPGVCDRSWGVNVAEMTHFPAKVIQYAKRKAEELEVLTAIKDNGNEQSISIAKKRRMEKKEGDELIAEFLRDVSELPVKDLTECEVSSKVSDLKKALIAKNNSYVNEIMARN